MFALHIHGELRGGWCFDVGYCAGHFVGVWAVGGVMFRELLVGMAELPRKGLIPLVDEVLLIDALNARLENTDRFAEEPFHIDVWVWVCE